MHVIMTSIPIHRMQAAESLPESTIPGVTGLQKSVLYLQTLSVNLLHAKQGGTIPARQVTSPYRHSVMSMTSDEQGKSGTSRPSRTVSYYYIVV